MLENEELRTRDVEEDGRTSKKGWFQSPRTGERSYNDMSREKVKGEDSEKCREWL